MAKWQFYFNDGTSTQVECEKLTFNSSGFVVAVTASAKDDKEPSISSLIAPAGRLVYAKKIEPGAVERYGLGASEA